MLAPPSARTPLSLLRSAAAVLALLLLARPAGAAPRALIGPPADAAQPQPPAPSTAASTPPACPPSATVARPPLRLVPPPPLADDLPLPPLLTALAAQIEKLEGAADPQPARDLLLPGRRVSAAERREGLQRFLTLARAARSPAALHKALTRAFDFYRAEFPEQPGVLITAYYEPVLTGSPVKTARLSQPLYREPPDLVTVDLARFAERLAGERPVRGRVVAGRLVPYFTREEIDQRGVLPASLALAYVDPVDAYLLHTEGSGVIRLPGGRELHLLFANHNGHPHVRLKPFLPSSLSGEGLPPMEEHMRRLAPGERQRLFNHNPRYVFFKPGEKDAANTTLGLAALAGRTIATDSDCFPKGGLAFLSGQKPVFAAAAPGERPRVARFTALSRFVLDQDTGGAILGPRVDLYWGRGDDAKRHAGVIKQRGELYYLIPKAAAPAAGPSAPARAAPPP